MPLLPRRVRGGPVAALAAVPMLGAAAASVAIVSVAAAGVPVDGVAVRVVLVVVVLAGLAALRGGEPPLRAGRDELLGAGGLLLALAAGLLLQERVIGGSPVPGNDWAKYVLYAEQIERHGSLLIDNPFWMLGVPFREDPGIPSLYGAFLALTGQPAALLMHGIWVFAVGAVLGTFALARSLWGPLAGVLAALLWAVIPISHDILAWHGLPNLAAIALLPLLLAYLVSLTDAGGLGWVEAIGCGLVIVAIAGAHRLSFGVALATVALSLAVSLLADRERARTTLTGAARAIAASVALAPGVAYDLVERSRSFGGSQGYEAYLSSKTDLGLVAQDLSWPFAVAAIAASGLALRWSIRDRATRPLLAGLTVIAALAYGWVAHVPLVYFRMSYFLPVVLAPLVALALVRVLTPRWTAALGAGLALWAFVVAWPQADNVRRFYGFANPASLRGLDAVATRLEPGEPVVTDRCWSFLATWLLHTRTLPALEPADIQPEAEAKLARQGRAVLDGAPAGLARARALGVRFLIVDPACSDGQGRPARPPRVGRPLYVSDRLAVLKLE